MPQPQPAPHVDETIQTFRDTRPVPCRFLTGKAGSGKTYQIVKEVQDDPRSGILCATTGIAAVNLNSVTLNSILHYFDTASMRDAYLLGSLYRALFRLAKTVRAIIIDEGSMMGAEPLDILYQTVLEVNSHYEIKRPLGLTLVGDFAQLPPIHEKWAFDSECWPQFAANTTRLEKVWRQDAGLFLDALNFARVGNGGACAETLTAAGVKWETARIVEFNGTTILALRAGVARHNALMLRQVPGKSFYVYSKRWGSQRTDWGQKKDRKGNLIDEWGIPPRIELKIGAYVMMLSNRSDFTMVNGDCGYIRAYDPTRRELTIDLVRTGKTITLSPLVRDVSQDQLPDNWDGVNVYADDDDGRYIPRPHFRRKARKYVIGQIERYPLALAYASTCHKAQGLTLDRVQVDVRDHFFSHPAMAYVALSRCRTLGGLRMVCSKDYFVKQVNMDPRVLKWL